MKYRFKLNILGKFNLIIFGLVAISLVGILYKLNSQKNEFLTVEIQVMGLNNGQQINTQPPSWLIDSIEKGNKELSYSGNILAEVLNIRSYEEGNNRISFFKLKLLVTKNQKQNTYRYKQKPLEIGSMVDVLIGNTRIYGSVTKIYNEDTVENIKNIKIKAALYEKQKWFADSIKVGDKVDGMGGGNDIQSQILSKKVIPSSNENNLSELVEIEMDLLIQVDERGGIYYFANYQPVKIGNLLYIPMKDYNLYGLQVMKVDNEN